MLLHLRLGSRLAYMLRTNLYEIFSPVFREIDKLVTEQVNMVYLKRVKQKHPKESIKVSGQFLRSLSREPTIFAGYFPGRRIWFQRVSSSGHCYGSH